MCPYCKDETQYKDFKKDIRPNLMLCQMIRIHQKRQTKPDPKDLKSCFENLHTELEKNSDLQGKTYALISELMKTLQGFIEDQEKIQEMHGKISSSLSDQNKKVALE